MVIEPAISSASLGRRSWYGHRFRADAARIRDLQGVTDGFPDFRNGLIDALLHDELRAFAVDLQGERVGDVQISVGRKADGGSRHSRGKKGRNVYRRDVPALSAGRRIRARSGVRVARSERPARI